LELLIGLVLVLSRGYQEQKKKKKKERKKDDQWGRQ
jgi:hypothetical protein